MALSREASRSSSVDGERTLAQKYPLRVTNVDTTAPFKEVKDEFNKVLKRDGVKWLKYTLTLHPPADKTSDKQHSGAGVILFNSAADARMLANRIQQWPILVREKVVYFHKEDGPLERGIAVRYRPQIPPELERKRKDHLFELRHEIRVTAVQFGVLGRDEGQMSVEWEKDCGLTGDATTKPVAWLRFNDTREDENPRAIQIEIGKPSDEYTYRISIAMNIIKSLENAVGYGQYFIIFELQNPPSFERKLQYAPSTGDDRTDRKGAWTRVMALDDAHKRVVPFTSRVLRIVFTNDDQHLENFISMSRFSRLPRLRQSLRTEIVKMNLFSHRNLNNATNWINRLPWAVGYQCEALLRNCLLEVEELFRLESRIKRLVSIDPEYAECVLRLFVRIVPGLAANKESPEQCLDRAEEDCKQQGNDRAFMSPSPGNHRGRHVVVTPTSYNLKGPEGEQSNRVIRKFGRACEEYFLRVAFTDEGGTLFRREFEVDNQEFVRQRVGTVLKNGITIAGRHFDFLAYSSSGLRQHSVWFVTPFKHPNFGHQNAEIIRKSLGDFSKVIHYPARYGARLSQAFSSTDPSVSVLWEEIKDIDDVVRKTDAQFPVNGASWGGDEAAEETEEAVAIKPRTYIFTDGCGTISPDLCREIWETLCRAKDRSPDLPGLVAPRAYQIRLGGYKGVVSVDYRLEGERRICLRPSMDKFDAPDSLNIEISEAFTAPSAMQLNRPLIMLLDTLGVGYRVFLDLQEKAVKDSQEALEDPERSAKLMNRYGVGQSYQLPQFLRRLEKYGLTVLHHQDPFIRKLLNYALYHCQREIKYHARIPVEDSWTLVGIADEHNQLEEGEIYACIQKESEEPFWIEGPTLISRSPTVHPGDAQMVNAIGKPKPGTPFAIEPMPNTVIFSVKGLRDLPNCLGGGDLDGDMYNVVTMPELHPKKCERAGEYSPVPQKTIHDRESNINDIADFVCEFINCNTLGLLGANHLRLADERPLGIKDPGCLKLADYYSMAVDYQKTGTPAEMDGLPKPTMKPDWACNELTDPLNGEFYYSTRALGHLFRNIRLSEPETPINDPTYAQANVVRDAIRARVKGVIRRYRPSPVSTHVFAQLFHRYSYELKYQCVTHNLQQSPTDRLSEEEVVIGTILGKTIAMHESRKRTILIERLWSQSRELVQYVKKDLRGDETAGPGTRLYRAWTALETAWNPNELGKKYGAKSFQLICLTSVLDALDEVEKMESGTTLTTM